MKQIILIILFTLSALSGCITHNYIVPEKTNRISNYQLTTEDFKIIGVVETEGTIHNLFFLIAWGGDGYIKILDMAREMGGDDIINYTFDSEKTGILLYVYNSCKWVARATVIKYTDRAIDKKLFQENSKRLADNHTQKAYSKYFNEIQSPEKQLQGPNKIDTRDKRQCSIHDLPAEVKRLALQEMTEDELIKALEGVNVHTAQKIDLETIRKLHQYEKSRR